MSARRTLASFVGVGALAAAVTAGAQTTTDLPHVAWASNLTALQNQPYKRSFLEGVRQAGQVEGRTFRLDILFANGEPARAAGYVDKILEGPKPANLPIASAARQAARRIGLALDELPVTTADDLQRALGALERKRPDALYVIIDTRVGPYRKIIADEALRLKIPSMSGYRGYAEVGGLMSYAANLAELYRRGASYVDRIFKGAKPGNLAIELPSKYELIFNLKTAKAIGLTIPPSLLLRADEVIQ